MAAIEPDKRNQAPVDEGATGASQGLLDRKEVLGGESFFFFQVGRRRQAVALWWPGFLGGSHL